MSGRPKKRKPMRIAGQVCLCHDCRDPLWVGGGLFGGGPCGDWFLVKDRVWRAGVHGTAIRFLCVKCLERHLGRKLVAADFKRSAKVNFVGDKSTLLRHRMRGLKPAKQLRETMFTW